MTVSVYNNTTSRTPNEANLCVTTTVSQIAANWGSGPVMGCNSDRVTVHYYGTITVPDTGAYRFRNIADDGFFMTIDGQPVISEWVDKGCNGAWGAPVSLTAGTAYVLDAWYYENGGGACSTLYVTQPSGNWQVAPAAWFGAATTTTYVKDPALLTILEQKLAALKDAKAALDSFPSLTINAPTQLTAAIDGSTVTLNWTAAASGLIPERYAIMWSDGTGGWGIATGNVGDATALNTSITIDISVVGSTGGWDKDYTFSIRADHDSGHMYSAWSNQATLRIVQPGPTPEQLAAIEAARLEAEKQAAIAAQLAAEAAAEAARLEALRIANEQAAAAAAAESARISAEKVAAEEAAKAAAAEAARQAAIAAEAARVAAEAEAARLAAEAEAKAAAEAAAKAEAERIAAEEAAAKAEAEAKAKTEEEARLEAERIAAQEAAAKEEAEAAAKAEEKRLAAEAAAKAEAEAKAAEAEAAAKKQALKDAAKEGTLTEDQKQEVASNLIEEANGGPVSAAAIAEAGIEYKDLPPETPVEVRQDENGNEVIITADVAAALVLLENPAELIGELFSDPGQALQALGSIGADMSPQEREEATNMVVATVVAAGAAMNAVGAAAGTAGRTTSGGSTGGGGSSGGGGASGESKGIRRRKP